MHIKIIRAIGMMLLRLGMRLKGVECAEGVRVRGWPQVYCHPEATIVIGYGVVIHSAKLRYHAHMHSPVKLLADRAGAAIRVGASSRINGACIHAVSSVSIGDRCLIAAGVQIMDSNGHNSSMDNPSGRIHSVDDGRPVVIEDDVWIGFNAIILPGSHIGAGTIVGAGAIVSGYVPPKSLVRPAPNIISSRS